MPKENSKSASQSQRKRRGLKFSKVIDPLTWFRLHCDFCSNPKVRVLDKEDRYHFIAFLTAKALGYIDQEIDQKTRLRRLALLCDAPVDEVVEIAGRLVENGLIKPMTFQPVGWDSRQFVSDHDKTKRSKQSKKKPTPDDDGGGQTPREHSRSVPETLGECYRNPPEAEAEAEAETEVTDSYASLSPSKLISLSKLQGTRVREEISASVKQLGGPSAMPPVFHPAPFTQQFMTENALTPADIKHELARFTEHYRNGPGSHLRPKNWDKLFMKWLVKGTPGRKRIAKRRKAG